ncbi:FAD-dependent oxidoreductase [Candidatus Bathyarchaeota archaeon]|nr:FAD-dependent oxidoreductase [Candidatus Bathyarchaeota archaeon]
MVVVPKTRKEMPVTTLSVPTIGSAGKTGFWRDFRPVMVELVSPCTYDCPANNRLPQIFEKIRDGKLEEAAKIFLETNPFPSITGRICPHFCEEHCNRSEYDEAVSIRSIERFLGDYILERKGEAGFHEISTEKGKKIGIIGSGPAGLSAAYYLRKMGYNVTIFESEEKPGGMLTYGIPPYRLPKQIVEKEVAALTKMGIEIKSGKTVGEDIKFEDVQKEFDAVLLAIGAWKERDIGISGEQLMMSGLEFLGEVNKGLMEPPGMDVAVIGGGNVSVDVARTLKRLKAKPSILYRRTEKEMPAISEEVTKAKEDGIEFHFLTQPVDASKKNGKIVLKCIRMRLGELDASGRRRPIPIEGSQFTLEFDAVIKAIGEGPDTTWIPKKFLNEGGWMKVDSATGVVGENLFAAGDLISGPATVVEAIAAGRRTARSINQYLRGEEIRPEVPLEKPVKIEGINIEYYEPKERAKASELPPEERTKSLDKEETSGISLEKVQDEAHRCFSCGYCRACDICWIFCPDGSVDLENGGKPEFDYDYCKGCGICSNECPCGVIIMEREEE